MIVNHTPVEEYNGVWVKREDLCSTCSDPPFSKYRGVVTHLRKRPERVIGVLDTFHSKAGWAVAAACKLLGKRCVNYWPHYKAELAGRIREPQQMSKALGAELRELAAGRSAILYHRARKLLKEEFANSYMMPNALKLEESAEETAQELLGMDLPYKRYVVSVSSGTIAAGVLRGLSRVAGGVIFHSPPQVFLHMGYSRSQEALRQYLHRLAPTFPQSHVTLVDEGYAYTQAAEGKAPFPCNAFYDLKAWNWLMEQPWKGKDTLFWNIGA